MIGGTPAYIRQVLMRRGVEKVRVIANGDPRQRVNTYLIADIERVAAERGAN